MLQFRPSIYWRSSTTVASFTRLAAHSFDLIVECARLFYAVITVFRITYKFYGE